MEDEYMAEKYSFLVLKYPKADTAMAALAALKGLSKEKIVKLKDAVAVTKTAKGKIKLHQTKDDTAGKGFVKGGLIGVIFAALFGPVGWVAAGAVIGGTYAMFDKGIKNKLLKELGQKMTAAESAVAILVEQADWPKAVERMKAHHYEGEVVVSEIVEKDMAEVEKLLYVEKAVATVPEEMEVPAPVEEMVETAPGAQRAKELEYIEGVGKVYSQKLKDAGIVNASDLLLKGCDPQGREAIAKTTGISAKLILRWVNMADLFRVIGIGQEYAELLNAVGVDSVPGLAQGDPADLLAKMKTANEQKKLVRRPPVLSQVESWVKQAKSLPGIVTY
jgi:uncharacterized membrane protein